MLRRVAVLVGGVRGARAPVLPYRQLGLFDKLKAPSASEYIASAQATKAAQSFADQIKGFEDTASFTYPIFVDLLRKQATEAGVVGWKSFFPGSNAKSSEGKQVSETLEFAEGVLKCGVTDIENIDLPKKREIIKKLKKDPAELNLLVRRFQMMKSLHRWVNDLKSRGIDRPKSPDQLQEMIKVYPMKVPKNLAKLYKAMSPSPAGSMPNPLKR